MSFKKYRFIDLSVFLIIYLVLEFLIETAAIRWFPETIFSVSLLLPISFIVMVRWEWHSIINIIIATAAFVLFSARPGTLVKYLIYILGSLGFIPCILLFTKKKSEKIMASWFKTMIAIIICYLAVNTLRGVGAMIFANEGIDILLEYLLTDTLNLVFSFIVVLIGRKAPGLLINQKTYLLALSKEKEENLDPENELEQD